MEIFRDITTTIVCLSIVAVVYLCVDRVSTTIDRVNATCPGPLKAGDYYTPEE